MSHSHQAQGLERLFGGKSVRLVSVLSAPQAPDSAEFVLALAGALGRRERRVVLVEAGAGGLSARLGCRPLLPWQPKLPLETQLLSAGGHGLLYAPGCTAGEAAIAAQAGRGCDVLLFDGGRFALAEARLEPAALQTVVVLLGAGDAEAAYALAKTLASSCSPARLLLLGQEAERVAQLAKHFLHADPEYPETRNSLYHISNNDSQTSSRTLSIAPNLSWVVSRILENEQPKVTHGGVGKKPSAKEVWQR